MLFPIEMFTIYVRNFLNMAMPRYTRNSDTFRKIYLIIKMSDFEAKHENISADFISDKM